MILTWRFATRSVLVAAAAAGFRMGARADGPVEQERDASSQPASAAASRPGGPDIDALVKRLGSDDYAAREAAQAQLARHIDAAADALLARVTDADPEIANRVELLLSTARGAVVRARIAVGLIDTGQGELVARAAAMLFEDGETSIAAFRSAASQGSPRVQAAAQIILSELEAFVAFEKSAKRIMEQTRERNPAISEQQPANIEEQRRGLCYYASVEAAAAAARVKPAATRTYRPRESFVP